MASGIDAAESSALPPIVLLIEDDRDMAEMYSTHFENDGVWMAIAASPEEGLGAIEELHPDLVITDIGFDGRPDGIHLVQQLKSGAGTRHTPVIVLTGLPTADLSVETRHHADLFLRKPVEPTALLFNVRRLIESSYLLRDRSDRLAARVATLRQKSSELRQQSRSIRAARGAAAEGACPQCQEPLQWIERGSIGGREYDYYEWCEHGCGLYCYDRRGASWIKLA